QVVNPVLMKQVVEALVRLRMNLIIPASFIDIRNPAEAALVREAARRGVFLSMHHVEPMGVSAFTFFNYWQEKTGEKPLFSFYSNREKLEEVWRVYAEEWARYPNVIWQIGLRGIADRPMWMADPGIPQSDADRGKLISEAMQVQRQIIREVDKRPNPPITTTLWAEGSTLNQAGHLEIPKNVTIVFSDNSPGWKWQKDFHETTRSTGHTYGVYYHHQLWGAGPHLAQGIPPQHTYAVFREAHQKQSTHYAILNASNLREFQLGLAASGRMLYDFKNFEPNSFTQNWMQERYGGQAVAAQQAYQTYFAGFVLHDRQQVPMLLDGQTRSFALGLLKKIELQLTDLIKYQEAEAKARQATAEATWGQTSLSDAHPRPANDQELLEKVLRQHQGHSQALRQAEALLPKLDTKQREFLKTNLLSQIQIMLGLEEWLIGTVRAKQSLDEGNKAKAQKYLKEAAEAFARMKTGLALNVTDRKWQHWYRGEKKMNLKNAEQLTHNTYQLISNP
ncbi:MAG: glycosyl hydrolase 115 family protein, partial [Bacteroidetes bacterium]|nr:glycosyl hydrolase 115 family protein [Bacteroidota bacterium]